jgi:hypothetical protein
MINYLGQIRQYNMEYRTKLKRFIIYMMIITFASNKSINE